MTLKLHLFSLMLVISTFANSQIRFEKGYLITNQNGRMECLIKNKDWQNNPSEFEYIKEGETNIQIGNVNNIKEFCIEGFEKYRSFDVDIDTSGTQLSNLSHKRNPLWSHKRLFLKEIVKGKASLFKYVSDEYTRFFFTINDSIATQLVYKEYYTNEFDGGFVDAGREKIYTKNNDFRQQLLSNVSCENSTTSTVKNLRYSQKDLINYFNKYNTCNGETVRVEKKSYSRQFMSFRLRGGAALYSSEISNPDIDKSAEFKQSLGSLFGVEAEYILPFNKNKWAINLQSTYSSFETSGTCIEGNITLDYQVVDINFGIKNYYYLTNNWKLFANLGLNVPISNFSSDITYINSSNYGGVQYSKEIESSITGFLGIGCEHKRLSFEIRYNTTNDLLLNYLMIDAPTKSLFFTIGYQIFSIKTK